LAEFKIEILLLLTSMVLFAASAFCFSYAAVGPEGLSYAISLTYPFRNYAISLVGFGGVLMTLASISYSKRSKQLV
jgi:hypothetical protein